MSEAVGSSGADDVAEALALNHEVERMFAEGIEQMASLGGLQRSFIKGMVKRGLGMSLEEMHTEVQSATSLLERVDSGETSLERAETQLVRYLMIIRQSVDWAKGLEPMIDKYARTPEQREQAFAIAGERLASAEQLAAVLERLTRE